MPTKKKLEKAMANAGAPHEFTPISTQKLNMLSTINKTVRTFALSLFSEWKAFISICSLFIILLLINFILYFFILCLCMFWPATQTQITSQPKISFWKGGQNCSFFQHTWWKLKNKWESSKNKTRNNLLIYWFSSDIDTRAFQYTISKGASKSSSEIILTGAKIYLQNKQMLLKY